MKKQLISFTVLAVLNTFTFSASAANNNERSNSSVASMLEKNKNKQDDNESLLRINAARLRYCVGQYQRCTEGLIPGLKYHHCGAALNYCNSQGIFDLPGGAANHNW